MHFIRTVANAQQAAPGKGLMDRRIVRTTHGTEHLHGAIGDPLQHRRYRHLDQRHVTPGAMVAGLRFWGHYYLHLLPPAVVLGAIGLELARRTIAKYREELKIPTSNQRKVLY